MKVIVIRDYLMGQLSKVNDKETGQNEMCLPKMHLEERRENR